MLSDSDSAGPNRRAVLRSGALATFGLWSASGLLTACGSGYPDEPDPLLPLLNSAEADANAAEHLAESGLGDGIGELLGAVARVRDEQAAALRAEIDRLNRPLTRPRDNPRGRVGGLSGLATRLAGARDDASSLVPRVPAHRAGLVGSVAAGCAGLQQLTPELEVEGSASATEISMTPVSTGELGSEAISAVRKALASEYAAIWVYGFVTAFLPAAFDDAIEGAELAHRRARDAAREVLTDSGTQPPAPAPAYVPDDPVTDEASAVRLVRTAEEDAARTWRGVLVRTDDRALRRMATRGLVVAAARAARWRDEAGTRESPVALPGAP